jgi:hypothetical protein
VCERDGTPPRQEPCGARRRLPHQLTVGGGEWPRQISQAIRDGAEGFFRTQYGSITKMACVLAVIIFGVYMFRPETPEQEAAGLTRCARSPPPSPTLPLHSATSPLLSAVQRWTRWRENGAGDTRDGRSTRVWVTLANPSPLAHAVQRASEQNETTLTEPSLRAARQLHTGHHHHPVVPAGRGLLRLSRLHRHVGVRACQRARGRCRTTHGA